MLAALLPSVLMLWSCPARAGLKAFTDLAGPSVSEPRQLSQAARVARQSKHQGRAKPGSPASPTTSTESTATSTAPSGSNASPGRRTDPQHRACSPEPRTYTTPPDVCAFDVCLEFEEGTEAAQPRCARKRPWVVTGDFFEAATYSSSSTAGSTKMLISVRLIASTAPPVCIDLSA